MSRDVTQVFLDAAFASEVDEAVLSLLKISHADLAEDIRVVANFEDITHLGFVYAAYPFDVSMPEDIEGSPPRAKLTIDNVSPVIIAAIEGLKSPPLITITIVLTAQPNQVVATSSAMSLYDITYDGFAITGELGYEQLTDEPYPWQTFVPSMFPGLA